MLKNAFLIQFVNVYSFLERYLQLHESRGVMGSDCLCNWINLSMTKSVRLTVALRIINLCMSGLTYMRLWVML